MADAAAASSSSSSSAPSGEIEINIRAPSDSKLMVSIDPSKTVAELKELIASKTDIEKDRQRLIYSGKILKDEEKVELYKIKSGNTVHLVKGASKAPPPPSQAQVPQNMSTGNQIAGNPLAPLLNSTNQIPSFNPFAQMGMNTNDPNMMQNYMNTPEAQQQMRSALSNPAVIDQIIDADPRLRNMPGIRDIMRSEQFINMISDPNAMRNAMQQARQLEQMGMMPPGGLGGLGGFGNMGGGAGGVDPWGAAFGGGQQQQGGAQAATGEAPRGPTNLFNQSAQPSNAAGAGAGAGQAGQMPDFGALQQMLGQMGGGGGAGAGAPFGGFGGFGGAGSPPPAQPQDNRPPEERYAAQLVQLNDMGFVNPQQNIRALQACGGNVQAAVEYLISSQGW